MGVIHEHSLDNNKGPTVVEVTDTVEDTKQKDHEMRWSTTELAKKREKLHGYLHKPLPHLAHVPVFISFSCLAAVINEGGGIDA